MILFLVHFCFLLVVPDDLRLHAHQTNMGDSQQERAWLQFKPEIDRGYLKIGASSAQLSSTYK